MQGLDSGDSEQAHLIGQNNLSACETYTDVSEEPIASSIRAHKTER